MADFGTILNPLNKTKDLYCNSVNVVGGFYINGVPIVDGSGNPNALINANLTVDIEPSSILFKNTFFLIYGTIQN